MGDVKAGGVYVEIGAKSSELDKALKAAQAKLDSFGKNIASLGTKMAGLGALVTAPLGAAAKSFADYGEQIGKLAAKTGMSTEALSGLNHLAKSTGIDAGVIAAGIKGMQIQISNGGKDAEKAFARLGTSTKELKALSPEQQFGLLADRISQIKDPAEKAALSAQAFGRAGVQLLPILDAGAAGLNDAMKEARQLGLVLDKGATDKANALDNAFDRLEGALHGFTIQVGSALAGALIPLVQQAGTFIARLSEWIRLNPEAIVQIGKMAVEFVAVGTALIGVGKGLSFLATMFSSSFGIGVAVAVALGAAVLAVTDTLGATQTGFGDLFNSIRVGGTGLGTWLAAFWNWAQGGFEDLLTGVTLLWESFWLGLKGFASFMIDIFSRIGDDINYVLTNMIDAINLAIKAYNAVARKPITMQIVNNGLDIGGAMRKEAQGLRNDQLAEEAAFAQRKDSRLAQRDARQRALDASTKAAFTKDPQDGTSGIAFDGDLAKRGLAKIGDTIDGALGAAFDKFKGLMPALPELPGGAGNPFGEGGGALGGKFNNARPEFSTVGTFNGFAGGALAATGVFGQQLKEAQKQTSLLQSINQQIGNAGGLE